MKLKPYTHWLDRCDFEKNEAGHACRRGCGVVLDGPLEPGTHFSCGAGGKMVGGYLFWCPGCKSPHPYRTARHPNEKPDVPMWDFNGNADRPSFTPSLLVYASPSNPRCHLFVTDGEIRYCSDCDHDLAGKTITLPDFPEDW